MTSITRFKLVAAGAISLAWAVFPSPASAETFSQARTVSVLVPIDDLNLVDPADRSRLDRRINAAVRQVCDGGHDRLSADEMRCRRAALQGGREQRERLIVGAVQRSVQLNRSPLSPQRDAQRSTTTVRPSATN